MKAFNHLLARPKYKLYNYYKANHPDNRFIVQLLNVDENSSSYLSACRVMKVQKYHNKTKLLPTKKVIFFRLFDLEAFNFKKAIKSNTILKLPKFNYQKVVK